MGSVPVSCLGSFRQWSRGRPRCPECSDHRRPLLRRHCPERPFHAHCFRSPSGTSPSAFHFCHPVPSRAPSPALVPYCFLLPTTSTSLPSLARSSSSLAVSSTPPTLPPTSSSTASTASTTYTSRPSNDPYRHCFSLLDSLYRSSLASTTPAL